MSTARDLCTSVLNYIGVIAANETPDAADINRAFDTLNDFMESLSTDETMAFAVTTETFPLVAAQASYTVGESTANWNTVRPGHISDAYVVVNGVSYTLTPLNNEQYSDIGMKALTVTWPQYFYYNPTFPNGTIKFWPVPAVAHDVTITSLKQFAAFASLDTVLSFPPGYARMLRWNLVKELCGAFGKSASAEDVKKASESKATLQRLNSKDQKMSFDAALTRRGGRYNIYTDNYQ